MRTTPSAAAAHGDEVAQPAGQHGREHQRAEELDRHGDPDRQPGERGVERPVHQRRGPARRRHGEPVRPGATAQPRPGDGQQHGRGEDQTQGDRPGRPDRGDERRRQRPAELHRDDRRRGPAAVRGRGWSRGLVGLRGEPPGPAERLPALARQRFLHDDGAGLGGVQHPALAGRDADMVGRLPVPGEEQQVALAAPRRPPPASRRPAGRGRRGGPAGPATQAEVDQSRAVQPVRRHAAPEVGQPEVLARRGEQCRAGLTCACGVGATTPTSAASAGSAGQAEVCRGDPARVAAGVGGAGLPRGRPPGASRSSAPMT